MDIEELVKKYGCGQFGIESIIRAVLTEQAAGYELRLEKLRAWMNISEERDARRKERIRQLEAERVPDGWKMVPVEPTDAMVDAACILSSFPTGVYAAMLAAAPAKDGE